MKKEPLYPKAKKSLGQNFLQSPKICQRIVDLLTVDAQTKILEIGPGHGALTSYLEQLGAKYLLLVEKDASLALERQKVLSSNAQCVLLDALNFPWERLDEAWVVVGNLPYNIASPLMYDLVSQAPLFKQAVFMLQKEVAERVCASPKCKAYGALSIWMQSFGVPKYAFKVAPSCFWPIPKVDSAVIAYVPKREPLPSPLKLALKALLNLCFQKRRKQLGGIFKACHLPKWDKALEQIQVKPEARPEELEVSQFHKLAEFWELELKERLERKS